MLNSYILATQLLLSNPPAPAVLYPTQNIIAFINTARLQLAGESECIRIVATQNTAASVNSYAFRSFAPSLPTGVIGVYNIRQMLRASGSGFVYMGSRPYPWALNYWLNNPAPVNGLPLEWAQYFPGDAGSFIVNPTPSGIFQLVADVSGEPGTLAADTDAEAIPYPYTDCIPFFAAYYAYMGAQRQSDADRMYARYQEYLGRAKKISVPDVLPMQYDQHEAPPSPQMQGGR